MRTFSSTKPAGRRTPITSPTGSSKASISFREEISASMRASVRASLSSTGFDSPAVLPFSRSRAFAAAIACLRASMAAAMEASAAFFAAAERVRSDAEAFFAARAMSVTYCPRSLIVTPAPTTTRLSLCTTSSKYASAPSTSWILLVFMPRILSSSSAVKLQRPRAISRPSSSWMDTTLPMREGSLHGLHARREKRPALRDDRAARARCPRRWPPRSAG